MATMSFTNEAQLYAKDLQYQYFAPPHNLFGFDNYPIAGSSSYGVQQIPPDICYPDFQQSPRSLDNDAKCSSVYSKTTNQEDELTYQSVRDFGFPRAVQDNYFEPIVSDYFPINNNTVKDAEQNIYEEELFKTYVAMAEAGPILNQNKNVKDSSGFEESFRSALLQYFSQVDQEKAGLVGDLNKLKEDLNTYLVEGKNSKLENIHQAKIISKLKENGKLFVGEIERLKDHLKKLDHQRLMLIQENNDLHRKLAYENEVIPHLDKEMKTLAEENQFLKLLAEDTKQLQQQEETIRSFQEKFEGQEKLHNKYLAEMKKQITIIHSITNNNKEMQDKIDKLTKRQEDYDVLKSTEKQYNQLMLDFKQLSREKQLLENQANGLYCTVNQLENNLNQTKNENSKVNKQLQKELETIRKKEHVIQEYKEKYEEVDNIKENYNKEIKRQEILIKNLSDEITEMTKENKNMHEEMRLLKVKTDALIAEDDIRSKDHENLRKKFEELEKQFNETNKNLRKAEKQLFEKSENTNRLLKKEKKDEDKISQLQQENEKLNDGYSILETTNNGLKERVKELQTEILGHVKNTSEMEQEMLLTCKTLKNLKKSNDHTVEQRSALQKEVSKLQEKLKFEEKNKIENDEFQKEKEKQLSALQGLYDSCKEQKVRLQKDILIIQDKLSKNERSLRDFENMKKENDRLQSELLHVKDQNEILQNELKNFEEYKVKLDQIENEKLDQNKELLLLKQQIKSHEDQLENFKIKKENLKTQNKNNFALKTEIDALRKKLDKAESKCLEIETLKLKIKELKSEKLNLLEENIRLKDKIHELESHLLKVSDNDDLSIKICTSSNPNEIESQKEEDLISFSESTIETTGKKLNRDEPLCLEYRNILLERDAEIIELKQHLKGLQEELNNSNQVPADLVKKFKTEIEILNQGKQQLEHCLQVMKKNRRYELSSSLHNGNDEALMNKKISNELSKDMNEPDNEMPRFNPFLDEESDVLPLINQNEIYTKSREFDFPENTLSSSSATILHVEGDAFVDREKTQKPNSSSSKLKEVEKDDRDFDESTMNKSFNHDSSTFSKQYKKSVSLNGSNKLLQLDPQNSFIIDDFLCSSDVQEEASEKMTAENFTRLFKEDEKFIEHIENNHQQMSIHRNMNYNFCHELNNLKVENNNLHEDIDNLLTDYHKLQYHLKIKEDIITSYDDNIKEREDEIDDLVRTINNKNRLIEDLEYYIDEQIRAIKSCSCKPDETAGEGKDNEEVEKLKKELNYYKFLHTQNIRDVSLVNGISQYTQKKVTFERSGEERLFNNYNLPIPNEKKIIDFEDPYDDQIEEFTIEIYEEIKAELINKRKLIQELEYHIHCIQNYCTNCGLIQNSATESNMNMKHKQSSHIDQSILLKLPQPYQTTRFSPSLPSVPKPILKRNTAYPSEEESHMTNNSQSYNGLKKEVINLNADVLQKKIDINRLEEELMYARQRQARAEESYRNVVKKNEHLEHEIFENRRQIKLVQEKQGREFVHPKHEHDTSFSDDLQVYHGNISLMIERQDNFDTSDTSYLYPSKERHEKNETNGYYNSRDNFDQNFHDERSRSKDQWPSKEENDEYVNEDNDRNHRSHSISQQVPTEVSGNPAVRNRSQQDLTVSKKQNADARYNTDQIRRENGSVSRKKEESSKMDKKTKAFENDKQKNKIEELANSNQELKKQNERSTNTIKEYAEKIDKLKAALNKCKNEKSSLESQMKGTKEKVDLIEELEEKISKLKQRNKELDEKIENFEKLEQENTSLKRKLNGEKETYEEDLRKFEATIGKLREELKVKEESNEELKNSKNEMKSKYDAISDELKGTRNKLKKIEMEFDEEIEKYNQVSKVSDDMNAENKRLMEEILTIKKSMETVNLENQKFQDKLSRLENEEENLDKLLVKTQKSNNELLENNQTINKELHKLRGEVKLLEEQLNIKENENHILKKNVENFTIDMDNKTRDLLEENKSLLNELNIAKKAMNEFDAILDQGQMDFDDLEMQLENYRQENIELDHKLHEVLKVETILKSENEEYIKQINKLNIEMTKMQEDHNDICNKNKELIKIKEQIELKNQEYKTRDQYFEERLKGCEEIIKTKDDLLNNDKTDKGNLQTTILELQGDLINYKNINEQLLSDKENMSKNFISQTENLKKLEKTNMELIQEKANLRKELETMETDFNQMENQLSNIKKERVKSDNDLQNALDKLATVENNYENEQFKRHQKQEELLTEISSLKRKINEKELNEEKLHYEQIEKDTEYTKILERNRNLEEKLKSIEVSHHEEKEKFSRSVAELNQKIEIYENDREEEALQFRKLLNDFEESKDQEFHEKLKEMEEITNLANESRNEINRKNNEIHNLKEDIVNLQENVETLEIKIQESQEMINQLNSQILYLEKENNEADLIKEELISNINEQQQLIEDFQEQKKEEDQDNQKYLVEIQSLKDQLNGVESLKEENKKLHDEIEKYLEEKSSLHERASESEQLRNEVSDLRGKSERVKQLLNEIQQLKQDLMTNEARHTATIDKLIRENAALKRQKDDLLKKTQDLELRNVNFVKANQNSKDSQAKLNIGTLPLKQTNNFFGVESFSPTKSAVATSTPTQEKPFSSPSINVTRQPSTFTKLLPSSGERNQPSNLPLSVKDELSSRPTININQLNKQNEDEQMVNVFNQSRSDLLVASPTTPLGESPFSSSIKYNPFLQMDKTRISQNNTPNPKPIKKPSGPFDSFDIRPQSTDDVLDKRPKSPKRNSYGVGNEFVSRLKAAFETN